MRIDICAIADYIEQPDPDDLILILDDDGLALARKQMEGAAFRIAFAHIGSASRFVSPHERSQVKRLLDAGFDLVVCTGSHFIKGFLFEQRRPVAYGLGDHLTSLIYSRRDAEPLGMHLVAGFGRNRLMQIFLVPFHNDIRAGRLGPLDETAFRHFVRVLQERSNSAEAKYYEDEGMLEAVTESLKSLRPSQLTRLKPRHFLYAARVVVQQRPEWVAAAGVLLAAVAAAAVFRRRSRRLRKENPGA
jgi:hypothetical protein